MFFLSMFYERRQTEHSGTSFYSAMQRPNVDLKNEQNLMLPCTVVCLVNVCDHSLTSTTLICLHQKAAKQAFYVVLMV